MLPCKGGLHWHGYTPTALDRHPWPSNHVLRVLSADITAGPPVKYVLHTVRIPVIVEQAVITFNPQYTSLQVPRRPQHRRGRRRKDLPAPDAGLPSTLPNPLVRFHANAPHRFSCGAAC